MSKTPRTEAGRAMLAAWGRRSWSLTALRIAIREIEAEAAPSREPDLRAHPDDGHQHSWGCRRCGVDPAPSRAPDIGALRAAINELEMP